LVEKRVLMVVRRPPLGSVKAAEALRQSVGLTMSDDTITVLLLDAGAWLAVPLTPEVIGGGQVKKHLDTLPLLKARVQVERESLQRYGIDEAKVRPDIAIVSREEAISEMAAAEAVIVF